MNKKEHREMGFLAGYSAALNGVPFSRKQPSYTPTQIKGWIRGWKKGKNELTEMQARAWAELMANPIYRQQLAEMFVAPIAQALSYSAIGKLIYCCTHMDELDAQAQV